MAKEIGTNNLLETWGSTGAVVMPSVGKIAGGWEFEEQPPHEYMNWVHNHLGQAINYLLRSGVPAWNTLTEYLTNDWVSFSGRLWLAAVDNQGSEPADANANWLPVAALNDGTAALPALSFASQRNTGLYRPATSVLAISVNGTERARFTTSGMQVGGSEVFRRANILGTVSQSAGVPTGAIIQRGSNANGEFVRFADGTQICTLKAIIGSIPIASATGSVFRSGAEASWTYPASFIGSPEFVDVNVDSGLLAFIPILSGRPANTLSASATFYFYASVSATYTDVPLVYVAIGRWF